MGVNLEMALAYLVPTCTTQHRASCRSLIEQGVHRAGDGRMHPAQILTFRVEGP